MHAKFKTQHFYEYSLRPAYQKGPLIPIPTEEDSRGVAPHVHTDTTDDAIRPVMMVLPAV